MSQEKQNGLNQPRTTKPNKSVKGGQNPPKTTQPKPQPQEPKK